MNEALAQRILELYGLPGQGSGVIQKGYRNESYPVELDNGNVVNIILYKAEAGIVAQIKRANSVSDYLADQGWPTRRTLEGRIVQLRSPSVNRYAAIYNYLPGETIPWEAYTQDHLKLLGLALGRLHGTLKGYPAPETLPKVHEAYRRVFERMERYFSDQSVQKALQAKLQLNVNWPTLKLYPQLLAACDELPGQQALHMDFVRSNILFAPVAVDSQLHFGKVAISGILDFEKTAFGHPLFDIARTLAFLLVDCKYKTSVQVSKYFLRSGYVKRGTQALPQIQMNVTDTKVDLLETLTNLFLFYDFYKFLSHNPYEFLAQNEHFIRTRDLLIERAILQTAPR